MRPENPKYPELWEVVVGKSGKAWLIPTDVQNRGDYIHCTNSKNWEDRGDGYGGSTINFKLADGTVFPLHGGWHSNSTSLYQDTGVDLRNEHYTFITTKVTSTDGNVSEIVYDTDGWALDEFDREEDVKWFTEVILPVVKSIQISKQSIGGGMTWTIVNEQNLG